MMDKCDERVLRAVAFEAERTKVVERERDDLLARVERAEAERDALARRQLPPDWTAVQIHDENIALRALLVEARQVVLPTWAGKGPKPAHLAVTPARQSLADRIDAALSRYS